MIFQVKISQKKNLKMYFFFLKNDKEILHHHLYELMRNKIDIFNLFLNSFEKEVAELCVEVF